MLVRDALEREHQQVGLAGFGELVDLEGCGVLDAMDLLGVREKR